MPNATMLKNLKAQAAPDLLWDIGKLALFLLVIGIIGLQISKSTGIGLGDEEGALAQIDNIQNYLLNQQEYLAQNPQETQVENVLDMQVEQDYVITFFQQGQASIPDTCVSSGIISCNKKEIIQRDIGCGQEACVCLYKATAWFKGNSCFDDNYKIIKCNPLPTSLQLSEQVIYGRCHTKQASIRQIALKTAKTQQGFASIIAPQTVA